MRDGCGRDPGADAHVHVKGFGFIRKPKTGGAEVESRRKMNGRVKGSRACWRLVTSPCALALTSYAARDTAKDSHAEAC